MDISSKKKSHFEGKTLAVRSELKFSFFQVSSHFSMIFCKISKFHDISMTGKAFITFPGFPGAVGTQYCCWFSAFMTSSHGDCYICINSLLDMAGCSSEDIAGLPYTYLA